MYSRAPAFHPLRRGGDDRSNYFVPSRTGGGEGKYDFYLFVYLFIFLFFRIVFGDFGGEGV